MVGTKTYVAKPGEIERQWWVADAEGQIVGRMATEIAVVLMGKHRPTYTPHTDTGDFVVVINAHKIHLTGKKWTDKKYYRHTGWMGGLVTRTAQEILARHPEDLVKKAVWGMMPKGPLGRKMYKKLKVYAAAEHPHGAQNPQQLKV